MDNDKFKNLLGGLGQFALPKIEPVMPSDDSVSRGRFF